MMDEKALQGLRNRYKDIHPLIFHRSMEKSKSIGELFDIMEAIPEDYPIVWNEQERKWKSVEDQTLAHNFKLEE